MKEWEKPQLIVLVRNVQKNVLAGCKAACYHSVWVEGAWVKEYDYDLDPS